MIQVLLKSSSLLEELSKRNYATLADLSDATGFNNSTICNILKTLTSVEYVEKTAPNQYSLGKGIAKLASGLSKRYSMSSLAEEYTRELAERTQESGLFSVLYKGEITILAKSIYNRSIIINAGVSANFYPIYTATGRSILAFMPPEERDPIIKRSIEENGWPKDLDNIQDLYKKLEDAKKNRMVIVTSLKDTEVQALAAPVFDRDKVIGALALNVPSVRFKGENRKKIISTLKHMAEKLTHAISL
jgi:DNA-binding IclR family transcriptional regulator